MDLSSSALSQLQALAREYAQLNDLSQHTPQSRGQRLNSLIAEMLQTWQHQARADLNSRGNIDVAFAIGRQRFILEAKWEEHPIGTGPISKLQKRVRQRLGGTIGVFFSMNGYTPDALRDIKEGERLEVILLDSSHLDAMITGFCPPAELFELTLDYAHFFGNPTTSLEDLLTLLSRPTQLTLGQPEGAPENPLRTGAQGLSAEWIAGNIPPGQLSISTFSDGRLLLTTGDGLGVIDPDRGHWQGLASLSRVSSAKVLRSQDIAIVRRYGVAVIHAGKISVCGGPYAGRITFVANAPDDNIAIFSNDSLGTGAIESDSSFTLIAVLGTSPGRAEVTTINYPACRAVNATQLPEGRILILGDPAMLFDQRGTRTIVPLQLSNPFSAQPVLHHGRVLVAGGDDDLHLVLVKPGTRPTTTLGSLHLIGSGAELTMAPASRTTAYVLAHHRLGAEIFSAVVKIDLSRIDLSRIPYDWPVNKSYPGL